MRTLCEVFWGVQVPEALEIWIEPPHDVLIDHRQVKHCVCVGQFPNALLDSLFEDRQTMPSPESAVKRLDVSADDGDGPIPSFGEASNRFHDLGPKERCVARADQYIDSLS